MTSDKEDRGRVFVAAVAIFLAATPGRAWAGVPVSVSSDGWTVTAEEEQEVLNIGHEGLGTVLQDIRLNLGGDHGLQRLRTWSVAKYGEKGLSIRTAQPRALWIFELSPGALRISCTTAEGVLTAVAPAPPGRIVARLLDSGGAPVTWRGTDEVKKGFGGSETLNPSFLPRRNPEVMYFALGQVSDANVHSLFDRKTDTAIDFPEDTTMKRSGQDADLLEVTVQVPGNTLVRLIPDYYTKTLGLPYYVPFDDTHFPKAPVVWCSWDTCYEESREEDIVREADWLGANLKPYGFQYIVLDEGYDGVKVPGTLKRRDYCWMGKWDEARFPHGPKWLTDYIKSKGLHAGLWLVPNAYACGLQQHPDWYLHYRDGKVVEDYRTPALDSTNPEVLHFLTTLFTALNNWGFEYYKFDGEHALPKYIPGVDTDRLYDKAVDPLVAYRHRLEVIHETVGPERFIEGCPAGTPLNGIGYFGSYFAGDDMYASWQGQYPMFSSINANAFLNHIVVYLMAGEGIAVDPPMTVEEALRKRPISLVETARTREDPVRGFGTTMAEARTAATYVALSGVVYPVSSVMPELPEDRVKLLKMTLPPMPILPVDLFSRGTDMRYDRFKFTTPDDYIHNYPEILDLKVSAKSGVYDVVGLTNWRSSTTTRVLQFADKLGLNPDASYVAFDFWRQRLLGVFKGQMDTIIEPHDTNVLLLHPLSGHPQLVGTSRHITGSYSINDLSWDDAKQQLKGSSETVSGQAYTLWIYVPKGTSISHARAGTKGNPTIPVQQDFKGNSLSLIFAGQPEPVEWEVEFHTGVKRSR